MSKWAAKSVVKEYGICSNKVHIIPGGANLNENDLPTTDYTCSISNLPLQPLRLGFVGKDWKRKGLPYLLKIVDILLQRNLMVEVVVIGPKKENLPDHSAIKSAGFIDKSTELSKYVELVKSFHFGCLFSNAEAFGISNLECLRLGVPIIANRVGGIPATLPQGLGHLFDLGTSPEEISDLLTSYISCSNKYVTLRKKVEARAEEFSWKTTINKFNQLWQGSKQFSYDYIQQ